MTEVNQCNREQAWQALTVHHASVAGRTLRELFANDDDRFSRFSIEVCNLLCDFSKHHIDDKTLQLLCELAEASALKENIEALFSGKSVNYTEQTSAKHTVLREQDSQPCQRMVEIVQRLHGGGWVGVTQKAITDIVHIGIGGSNLGQQMVVEALAAYKTPDAPRCHFIANMDIADSLETLCQLNPETTLCIIASKSFTTRETVENKATIMHWLSQTLTAQSSGTYDDMIKHHVLAVTTNTEAALAQHIPVDNILNLPVEVGGRYSLWSNVGLVIAIAVGMDNFNALLKGAGDMDVHFRDTPFSCNMPVVLALLSIWYIDFWKAQTQAILPYAHALRRLPAYLQQLDMESNGKRMRRDSTPTTYPTGAIIWGGVGSNSQHSFHQLLFQGTHFVPIDFIVAMTSNWADKISTATKQQLLLVANCFSQSHALMYGKSHVEVYEHLLADGLSKEQAGALAPHKAVPGNQPSTTLLMPKLTPYTLGALLAMYEHKTFVQSVIWGINPFDQWAVELGKQQSAAIIPSLEGKTDRPHVNAFGASTEGLINYFRRCTEGRD